MSAPIVIPSEPSILMLHPGIAEYQGTRAMLEAEGLIPADTRWPEGYTDMWWDDGKYRYLLMRQRPHGAKGPRKLFIAVDWWSLRQQLIAEDHANRMLMRKKQELAEYLYRNSPQGRADSNRSFNSYAAACGDVKFQAFKALIPGLIKPKRGRRFKSAGQPQGAAA